MNSTFKSYNYKLFVAGLVALAPLSADAKTAQADETDSLNADKEMVQVAYRQVAKDELLGGVSVVDVEDLMKKDYHTYSLDNMQALVGGWNGNSLWAQDANNAGYLVLVDGVPREATNVLPSEISQITFLKGAQAVVLYGSKAAKGAILITTKRGKVDGIKVDVTANTGWYVAKSYPEYLSSAEYMTLYNKGRASDGLSPLYKDEIYDFGAGDNPYRYPNVDYYSSDYIRKAYNRSEATAEIEGGGKRAHFYSNINFYRVGDVFKFGEAKRNHTNRFNVRGNVDVNISDDIKAYVNANATFYDASSAKGNYWSTAASMRPNYPQNAAPLIPIDYISPSATNAWALINNANLIDGKYFLAGSQENSTHIFGDIYSAGKTKYTSRQFQFDTGIKINLAKLLKGLSFETKFAVDYATSYNTSFDNNYAVYIPTWANINGKDEIVSLKKEGDDKHPGVQNISNSMDNQTMLFSAQFNYQNTFSKVHNFSAMLIASGFQQTKSAVYHKNSSANLALDASYNYAQKYYLDFGMAAIHSAQLAPGHREALSPSLTLGWRLKNENFLKDSKVVDDMMISASYSDIKQDIDLAVNDQRYYLYMPAWSQTYGYAWADGGTNQYAYSTKGGNNDLGFISRKEFSVNFRTSLWQKLLTMDANFFVTTTDGLLVSNPTYYPSYLSNGYPTGGFIPVVNFNADRRTGFDFALTANKKFGEVDLALGVTGTYYTTKATKRDEVNLYDYQNRQGKVLDGIWGFKTAGIFQSKEEIAEWADQSKLGNEVKPGDLKYIDQNGDNVIDSNDMVYLGKGGWYGSPFTMGINFTAKWKGFTFFALGTANFGAYASKLSLGDYFKTEGNVKYSEIARDAWTPENATTALYPRLASKSTNNYQTSDFWLYKTDAFRLAKVQVTYDLPSRLFQKTWVKSLSAFVSGSNLLTISGNRKWLEMSVGQAPQTRYYNIGVKASF